MKRFTISGCNHVSIQVPVIGPRDLIPFGWSARVLIVWEENGEPELFWPLYDYMIERWPRSSAWQAKTVRAVGLFWDYLCASKYRSPGVSFDTMNFATAFKGFLNALVIGTAAGCSDGLGLYWLPQPAAEIRRIRDAVHSFSAWAVKRQLSEAGGLLPRKHRSANRKVPARIEKVPARIEESRANRSLLSYLGQGHYGRVEITGLEGVGDGPTVRATSFPSWKVEEVLWEGFRKTNGQTGTWDGYYVRDMMIFLLQVYAGAREHEPLHLWVVDVTANLEYINQASVTLFHPRFGLAYVDDLEGGQVATDRETRLQSVYGLPPRTLGVGSYRLGWKRSKTIGREHFAFLYWSDPLAATLFMELFKYYIGYRARIMAQRRALGVPEHPFLFVSERESRSSMDGYKYIGAPASIQSYDRSLRRAVTRCGLAYSKQDGTTSHGARHLYAYTLRALGLPRVILQEGLRHRNPFSSDRYGLPSPLEVDRDIKKAVEAAGTKLPDRQRLALTYASMAERHPEYLGGSL